MNQNTNATGSPVPEVTFLHRIRFYAGKYQREISATVATTAIVAAVVVWYNTSTKGAPVVPDVK
jgi:hypothetical protein